MMRLINKRTAKSAKFTPPENYRVYSIIRIITQKEVLQLFGNE